MTEQKLLLAVDGGGTKTDVVLFTEDGTVLKRIIGGPSNSSELGFERSSQTLKSLFEKLLSDYDGLKASLYSIYVGLAGGGIGANKDRYKRLFMGLLPNALNLGSGSDAVNGLNSGLGTGDGMALIAGTGSAVFSRCCGKLYQVGGWGHLLGDEGSGYDMASKGLRRTLKAMDGRASSTIMYELFSESIGKPVVDAIPEIYEGGKRYIASLAPVVLEAADKNDEAALYILRDCAYELSSMLTAGSRFLDSIPYRVVLTGGLWNAANKLLEAFVKEQLDERFEYIHPKLPPVYGAAVEAMAFGGLTIDDEFERNFTNTLSIVS